MKSLASGYFTQNGLLLRKWTPCYDKILGAPVVQIVIPKGLREFILKTAHGDIAGHFGVKKTYHSVMCFFFWPRFKARRGCFYKNLPCVSIGRKTEQSDISCSIVSYTCGEKSL